MFFVKTWFYCSLKFCTVKKKWKRTHRKRDERAWKITVHNVVILWPRIRPWPRHACWKKPVWTIQCRTRLRPSWAATAFGTPGVKSFMRRHTKNNYNRTDVSVVRVQRTQARADRTMYLLPRKDARELQHVVRNMTSTGIREYH